MNKSQEFIKKCFLNLVKNGVVDENDICPATVTDEEIDQLQDKFNVKLPNFYRDFLKTYSFVFEELDAVVKDIYGNLSEHSIMLFRNLNDGLKELSERWEDDNEAYGYHFLAHGYIPIGDWGAGWGPLCIDTHKDLKKVILDNPKTWTVVWFDHEEFFGGNSLKDFQEAQRPAAPDFYELMKWYFMGKYEDETEYEDTEDDFRLDIGDAVTEDNTLELNIEENESFLDNTRDVEEDESWYQFDLSSRRKLREIYLANWEERKKRRRESFSKKENALLVSLQRYKVESTDEITDISKWDGVCSMAEILRRDYSNVVDMYVPKKYEKDYYYLVDKYVKRSYILGEEETETTVDSEKYFYYITDLLKSYRALDFYGVTIEDYIQGNMSKVKLDYQKHAKYTEVCLEDLVSLIIARIDGGDQKLIDVLKEELKGPFIRDISCSIFNAESETVQDFLVEYLMKSKGAKAYVNNAIICEQSFYGTPKSVQRFWNSIMNKDLLSQNYVKQAILRRTKFYNYDTLKNGFAFPSKKAGELAEILPDMLYENFVLAITDIQKAREFVNSDNRILIMIGLWVLYFYQVKDLKKVLDDIRQKGTENQTLILCYMNSIVYDETFCYDPIELMDRFPNNQEIELSCIEKYPILDIRNPSKIANCICEADEKKVREHYKVFMKIFNEMKGSTKTYPEFIVPWFDMELNKVRVMGVLCGIAYGLKDQEMVDEICPHFSAFADDREYYIKLFLRIPQTEKQKRAVISYLEDPKVEAYEEAYAIALDNMEITEKECELLMELLNSKKRRVKTAAKKILDTYYGRDDEEDVNI